MLTAHKPDTVPDRRHAPFGRSRLSDTCRYKAISPAPLFPNTAGQSAFAIYKQLHDFKSGARASDLMTGIAQGLTDDQMVDIATHFAAPARGTLDPRTVTPDEMTRVTNYYAGLR